MSAVAGHPHRHALSPPGDPCDPEFVVRFRAHRPRHGRGVERGQLQHKPGARVVGVRIDTVAVKSACGILNEVVPGDELCLKLGFVEAKVATAVNGSFVAASARPATPLAEADEIEIVAPRQGG